MNRVWLRAVSQDYEKYFDQVELTDVRLRVRDLATARRFYHEVLGLAVRGEEAGVCRLGAPAGRRTLLVLEEAPRAPARPLGTAGLFHIAFLLPDRAALGRLVRRLDSAGVPFGDGDHGVSEALYLDDPEGNGLELYVDRPTAEWPLAGDGQVAMYTRAVDLDALLAAAELIPGPLLPAETRVGHIHLAVSELARAGKFYGEALGFAVRQRDFPGALFLGRDGYHHHFGANIWRTRLPAVTGALGLVEFAVRWREAQELSAVVERLRRAGHTCEPSESGWVARDLDGLTVRLCSRES